MANKIEVKQLSLDDLKGELATLEAHLHSLKYRNAIAPLENTSEISLVRRQIARIHTELRARELAQLEGTLKRDKLRARRKRMKKA